MYGVSYELMYDNLDQSAIRNQTFKNSNYFGIISQYSHNPDAHMVMTNKHGEFTKPITWCHESPFTRAASAFTSQLLNAREWERGSGDKRSDDAGLRFPP